MSARNALIAVGSVLVALAVSTALLGLWLNVLLDGLDSNTCNATVFTVVIFGIGAWVCLGLGINMEDD